MQQTYLTPGQGMLALLYWNWFLVTLLNWKIFTSFPGTAHKNRVFIHSDANPKVFDPVLMEWPIWPKPTVAHGGAGSLIRWWDILILFGGARTGLAVEMSNVSNQNWITLPISAPFHIQVSGCTAQDWNLRKICAKRRLLTKISSNSSNPCQVFVCIDEGYALWVCWIL